MATPTIDKACMAAFFEFHPEAKKEVEEAGAGSHKANKWCVREIGIRDGVLLGLGPVFVDEVYGKPVKPEECTEKEYGEILTEYERGLQEGREALIGAKETGEEHPLLQAYVVDRFGR